MWLHVPRPVDAATVSLDLDLLSTSALFLEPKPTFLLVAARWKTIFGPRVRPEPPRVHIPFPSSLGPAMAAATPWLAALVRRTLRDCALALCALSVGWYGVDVG
jgi:hypothetical protein